MSPAPAAVPVGMETIVVGIAEFDEYEVRPGEDGAVEVEVFDDDAVTETIAGVFPSLEAAAEAAAAHCRARPPTSDECPPISHYVFTALTPAAALSAPAWSCVVPGEYADPADIMLTVGIAREMQEKQRKLIARG